MEFLERLASRFLIWRIAVGYGDDQCNTVEDWEDGNMLYERGCAACKSSFVRKFLQEHIDLLNYK